MYHKHSQSINGKYMSMLQRCDFGLHVTTYLILESPPGLVTLMTVKCLVYGVIHYTIKTTWNK
jgi:hypothetical protein